MISYKKLKEYVDVIQRYDNFDDEINGLIRDVDADRMSSLYLFGDYRECLTNAVSLLLEGGKADKITDDILQYWISELEFGKKYKDGCISEMDGTNIKIETLQDIYDYYKKEFWSLEDENNKK